MIGLFLFKTIRTINPFWETVEFNQGLMNKSNNDLTSHRKGRVGPLSRDMCRVIDFDWPAFVEENQNNTSLLGEDIF